MPKAKPSWIHKKLKLSHSQHSFKRMPHKHTSRGLLVCLTLAAGVLMFFTIESFATTTSAITGTGFLGLRGLVKPTTAATLDQPINKQTFGTKQIFVSGTCPVNPPNNIVKVIDNGIITYGPCDDGKYNIKIDLFTGVNFLRARVSDIYGQNGPDSTVIRVYYYYVPVPASPFNISSESDFAANANSVFSLKLKLTGGQKPYAFNINWGDNNTDLVSRDNTADFTTTHSYKAAGEYTITVNASDSGNQKAYTQTVVLVSGPGAAVGNINNPLKPTYIDSSLKLLTPLYLITAFGVFIFWLGEIYGRNRSLRLDKNRRTKGKYRFLGF